MSNAKFAGFSPGLIHFLYDLSIHNDRDWFNAHKSRYETELLEPSLAFIDAMAEPLKRISPHYRAVAKRVGGSLMRIYRDTRFSNDKSPYKTNVGIYFRHEKGKNVHTPGFYFHIDPDQVFLGAGIWHPDSVALAKIRKSLVKHDKQWKKVCSAKAFRTRFERAGDVLKRPPRGYDPDHPMIDDLKRKDHIAVCYLETDQLFEPSVVKDTAANFRAATGYVGFLCDALRLAF